MTTLHTFTFAAEKVAPTTARLHLATFRTPDAGTTRAAYPTRDEALSAVEQWCREEWEAYTPTDLLEPSTSMTQDEVIDAFMTASGGSSTIEPVEFVLR